MADETSREPEVPSLFDLYRALQGTGGGEVEGLRRALGTLTELTLALLVEVEALRAAQLEDAKDRGVEPKASAYGRAYRDVALAAHDSAGPSTGIDKLLRRFFRKDARKLWGAPVRETIFLERLGLSAPEIDEFVRDVESHASRT